jgi:hypothetical protein
LAAFQQSQPMIAMMLQLQRQAERNQQLIAKVRAAEPPPSAASEETAI